MKKIVKCIIAAFAMCLLILDTRTALMGASAGIELCIKSILPALFPFCFLSKLINSNLIGSQIPFLRPVGKLCKIPAGAESILLLGFIGGYPFGAQCISDAFQSKAISKQDAQRMLGFCNNAGPAFLFGILGPILGNKSAIIGILCIQILSAIIVGIFLPGSSHQVCNPINGKTKDIQTALEESIYTMALVCGWVILFRILIAYLELWLSGYVSPITMTLLKGLLELSNGCISLAGIEKQGTIYILSAIFLSVGGFCVSMQTKAITKAIGNTYYLPGKIMQTCLAAVFSCISQPIFFDNTDRVPVSAGMILLPVAIFILIEYILYKKGVEIHN